MPIIEKLVLCETTVSLCWLSSASQQLGGDSVRSQSFVLVTCESRLTVESLRESSVLHRRHGHHRRELRPRLPERRPRQLRSQAKALRPAHKTSWILLKDLILLMDPCRPDFDACVVLISVVLTLVGCSCRLPSRFDQGCL